MDKLSKQYDSLAKKFSKLSLGDGEVSDPSLNNSTSKKAFYKRLDFIKKDMKLLDLACGDGTDMLLYQELGAKIYGLDSSKEMLEIAKKKFPLGIFKFSDFSSIPFENSYFDVVLSKYAIQTTKDVSPVFREIHRVLKKGGIVMILVVHPFRQFFERKNLSADYFKQVVVDSNVFQGKITFKEPTHTFNEYFSLEFLKKFDLLEFHEQWEPCAEQINNAKYPGFFIIKAKKR